MAASAQPPWSTIKHLRQWGRSFCFPRSDVQHGRWGAREWWWGTRWFPSNRGGPGDESPPKASSGALLRRGAREGVAGECYRVQPAPIACTPWTVDGVRWDVDAESSCAASKEDRALDGRAVASGDCCHRLRRETEGGGKRLQHSSIILKRPRLRQDAQTEEGEAGSVIS